MALDDALSFMPAVELTGDDARRACTRRVRSPETPIPLSACETTTA